MVSKQDEFERRARSVLGKQPELVEQLLLLRKQVQREGEEVWSQAAPPSAESLNAANRRMIDRAASLLGPANFKRVFGFAPNQKFDIVDPRMMQAGPSDARAARGTRAVSPGGASARPRSHRSIDRDKGPAAAHPRKIYMTGMDTAALDRVSARLEAAGYEVTRFADGAALVAVAQVRTPAAILMDVRLPDKSGIEIIKELRGEKYPAPIIMLSARSDVGLAASAIRDGAFDFFEKPLRGSEVVARLDQAIGTYALTHRLTRREREIFQQVATGASAKDIGRALGITSRTVEDHRASIMKKLGARDAADLIRIAAAQRHS